jgi:hypothetical protein
MGATTIPAPSSEQRQQQLEALARGNDVRTRRPQLKRDLKAGRRPIEEVLDNPPGYLSSATILDLLIATPNRRRIKANKVLLCCRISPSRTVGALTERQRRVIVSELQRS